MKLNRVKNKTGQGSLSAFTLIEMIGVLAVIAILAALLVPKVFSAINDARVNNAAVSIATIKTAVVDHYGKYGKLNSQYGTNDMTVAQLGNYDKTILLSEGLIDKPFTSKIAGGDAATNSVVDLIAGGAAIGSGGYSLDGSGTNSTASATHVVQAVLYNVPAQDAKDLNDRVDGTALGAGDLVSADLKGRVEYAAPSAGVTTVYVYLTHR
jgi:type II secretory pathway pseudopilin PulG